MMGAIRALGPKRFGLAHVLVGLLALSVLAGSTGCWSSSSTSSKEARKKLEELKKKKKPKPPFERLYVMTEPHEKTLTEPPPKEEEDEKDEEEKQAEDDEFGNPNPDFVRGFLKPGHWTGVLLRTTANHADFSGELLSTPLDSSQNPIDIPNSAFRLATSRPVALAKEQPKTLETMFFAPDSSRSETARKSTQMGNQLLNRRSGTVEWNPQPEILQHMPAYQYYLYVLARNSTRYGYFKDLASVKPPLPIPLVIADDQYFYRVLTPRPEAPLALPSRALAWTSIAYFVWDEVQPSVLSSQQQQALVDWLHWGGGLIISGPRTLDLLRGSFLEPYLPAVAAESIDLDAAALAELNEHWTLADSNGKRRRLAPSKPLGGVKLAKHPDARFLAGTGELVVERPVGRGRVVATAFRLNDRDLIDWPSKDNFVNGCLLRRPPRRFDDVRQMAEFLGPHNVPVLNSFDPRLSSGVRFFTRDTDRGVRDALAPQGPASIPSPAENNQDPTTLAQQSRAMLDEQWRQQSELESLKGAGGAAGWDDFNEAATLARDTLREAAGISVPNRRFVVWMVGLYLIIVVPLNWLVFRAAGRVEMAWLAVPVLAVGWGVVVVWMAQLDIGFARAETEVAVLELQNDYSRAHLTRYMALYSSLSTTYDVHYDDPSALAQPLALDRDILPGQSRSTVTLRSGADQQLTDFSVASNSTGMVHSEQMVNLNGALRWSRSLDGQPTLENTTRLHLSGVVVLRRSDASEGDAEREAEIALAADAADDSESTDRRDADQDEDDTKKRSPPPPSQAAWVGELAPGAVVEVELKPLAEVADAIAEGRAASAVTAASPPAGTLSLVKLTALAEDPRLLREGDVRLIGWYDHGLPGIHADPAAAQARRATLVVANLEFADAPPRSDANLYTVRPTQGIELKPTLSLPGVGATR